MGWEAGWKGSSSARSLASHGMAGGKIKWPRHPGSKHLCTSRMLHPIHSWNPIRLGARSAPGNHLQQLIYLTLRSKPVPRVPQSHCKGSEHFSILPSRGSERNKTTSAIQTTLRKPNVQSSRSSPFGCSTPRNGFPQRLVTPRDSERHSAKDLGFIDGLGTQLSG